MVMRTMKLIRVRVEYLHDFRIELRHELVVHIDFLPQLHQSFYAVFIRSPVPRIYIHIVLNQRTDTLRTSVADAELENRDLV